MKQNSNENERHVSNLIQIAFVAIHYKEVSMTTNNQQQSNAAVSNSLHWAMDSCYSGFFPNAFACTSGSNCTAYTPAAASIPSNNTPLAPPPFVVARPSLQHRRQPSAAGPNDLPTHPVPEFLCHVLAMVQDPSLSPIISWVVSDESVDIAHGDEDLKGTGKIVIHDPKQFEEQVLGKYYRHSKFSSFQRQMNYFDFSKRVLGGRGKLSACEFVNKHLSADPVSLLGLKRRMKREHHTGKDNKERGKKVPVGERGRNDKDGSRYMNIRGNRFAGIASATDDVPSSGLLNGIIMRNLENASRMNQHQLAEFMGTSSAAVHPFLGCTVNLDKCWYPSATSNSGIQTTSTIPLNSFSTNPVFPVNPNSNPFLPHAPPNIKHMASPQLLPNNVSNAFDNKNATFAAQQAKQSLFEAYQQSQLDLLRKNVNHSNDISKEVIRCPQGTESTSQVTKPVAVTTHPGDTFQTPVIVTNPILPVAKRSNEQQGIPLPSSIDELFDDGSDCSLLCDEDELKDADDCSMLSVELGLVG
jgi:hypothetical protein